MTQEPEQNVTGAYDRREEAYKVLIGKEPGNKFDASKVFAESAL